MRIRALLFAAALAFASPALADTTPVSFSPQFQTALEEEFGEREGEILSTAVSNAIQRELSRRGVSTASATIDVTIVDAKPNHPTLQQLASRPGLDIRSISIGGAELHAVIRSGSGQETEVTHRRYNASLADVDGASATWTAARSAIRQFAVKVADAYTAPR